ncbi:amidase [Microbulbifer donghaiensis]|uniref:Amidase n=1 Tax=Microbulbifer donghaiensis TaxID=494016 RepID=A0A1M4Y3P5_9GAMM|nr:amidase [Microbulbifer donghaiensis]SHF00309.1 amidase [Microbulbifer donghaiensis]
MKTIRAITLTAVSLLAGSPSWANDSPSVTEIRRALDSGSTTSEQLVIGYQKLIEKHNGELRAVTQISPAALREAARLDQLRTQGKLLGPLHGIPVLLKDNIDTADGLANTAGSGLLADNFPERDAFLVDQLKKAGAIVLGKANLSEWANFRSTNSSSGWSATGGQTRNPYDLSRSPCGSSAGSAVAVAAGLAPLAVGTETDGSVTCPSAINGIVGIKPTLGLISRSGIIPISVHQDTAGPMATTVTGAVLLLDAMVGRDSADPFAVAPRGRYADNLVAGGLKGMRIGVARNLMGYSARTDEVFERALDTLKSQGSVIVDNANIETLDAIHEKEFDLLSWDFKDALNDYLAGTTGDYKSLDALIEGNEERREREMPYFGQEIFIKAQTSRGRSEPDYDQQIARLKSLAGKEGIDATLKKYGVDILVAPTVGPAWKIDHINGDHYQGSATTPAAVAGYPHITVPMGFVEHLPVGISFFAGANREDILIRAAYNYEQASLQRRAPEFLAGDPM